MLSLRMTGQLVVAQGRSGRRRLARQAEAMEALGLPCERLDDRRLRGRLSVATEAPGSDDEGPAALRLPVAGLLHPGRLLAGLVDAVKRHGAARSSKGPRSPRSRRGAGQGPPRQRSGIGGESMWWSRRAVMPRR